MFFFISSVLSVIVWLLVALFFDFSIVGLLVGLVVSWVFKEFIAPIIIIGIGEKTANK